VRVAFFLLLVGGAIPLPIRGQDVEGSLTEARVTAELTAVGAWIAVVAEFKVQPGEGTREIPFTVIRFGDTEISDVQGTLDGEPVPIRIQSGASSQSRGALTLSGDGLMSELRQVHFRYRVDGGWSGSGDRYRVTLPLIVVPWAPEEARPETFAADIVVPESLSIYGSFPTGELRPATSGGRSHYRLGLQVVPSVLTLRASVGGPPILTVTRVLDGFVVLLLLAFGISGWRYLRRRT
jgi:hypothetical protein